MGTTIPLRKKEYLHYQKDPEERERWLRIASGNNIPYTVRITLECDRHWSDSFETLTNYSKETPKVPPFLFDYLKIQHDTDQNSSQMKTCESFLRCQKHFS